MAIEKIKKFVREHKKEIIIGSAVAVGTAVLTVVGVKCGVPEKLAQLKKDSECATEFNNQLYTAMTGCENYLRLDREDVDKWLHAGEGVDPLLLRDPAGNVMKVESIIAFGNKV